MQALGERVACKLFNFGSGQFPFSESSSYVNNRASAIKSFLVLLRSFHKSISWVECWRLGPGLPGQAFQVKAPDQEKVINLIRCFHVLKNGGLYFSHKSIHVSSLLLVEHCFFRRATNMLWQYFFKNGCYILFQHYFLENKNYLSVHSPWRCFTSQPM